MSIEYDVQITGVDALLEKIGQLEFQTQQDAANGLVYLAKRIVQVIKDEYVPVYIGVEGGRKKGVRPINIRVHPKLAVSAREHGSGVLRDSVDCDQIARIEGDELIVEIWAGAPGSGAEEYAAVQHENLMFKHAVGQAKYIEVPVNLICSGEMAPTIAKYVNEQFQGNL